MIPPEMSPAAVTARIRQVAALSDLRTENRLQAKTCLSPGAITRRLRAVAQMRMLCLKLRRTPSPPI